MGGLGSVLRVAAKVLVIPVAAVAGAALAALLFSPEPLLPARERTLSDERTVTARETPIPPLLGDRVLRGLVVAPDGRPIANAAVRATAGLVVAETKANEFGRFVIERLPSSPAQLVALADGYRPARVGPIEPGTNDVTVTLSLVAPITTASAPARLPDSRSSRGSLAVTVRAPGGDPAPGLTIAVLPPSQEIDAPIFLPRTAALDDPASPVARIGDLPPGRYPVIAVASGGAVDPHLAFGEATVEIAPGAEVHLDLEVNWATLRGRVTSATKPAARAFVRLARVDGDREVEIARAIADNDGRFALARIPLGKATLEAVAAGHAPWSRPIAVAPDAPAVEIELTRSR